MRVSVSLVLFLVLIPFCLTTLYILHTLEAEHEHLGGERTMHHMDEVGVAVFMESKKKISGDSKKTTITTNAPTTETPVIDLKKLNAWKRDTKGNVHMFYYPWYANPDTDKRWSHWNHHILPHWDAVTKAKYKYDVAFEPPDDVGANFYPQRGPYSSNDTALLAEHMAALAGYVVVVSWWGVNGADGEGYDTNSIFNNVLKAAEEQGASIAIHLEPYQGRNEQTVKRDIQYLYDTYGKSPALYRYNNKIVLYVYDSYHTPAEKWATVFSPQGADTIRGTEYDAIAICLYLELKDASFAVNSHFDGIYTYFAADGFTYGSSPAHWGAIAEWAKTHNKLFSVSVGPGYDDTRIRPWNANNKKSRENGAYYDRMWNSAIDIKPDFVSITSYNEWHEGTQIEEAIPKTVENSLVNPETGAGGKYEYSNYLPLEPDYYMKKTNEFSEKFMRTKTS